jgi:hypothetical protein
VLDSAQNLLSCCSCLLSADSMLTFSVAKNLLGGPTKVGTGVIKVVSSAEFGLRQAKFRIHADPRTSRMDNAFR